MGFKEKSGASSPSLSWLANEDLEFSFLNTASTTSASLFPSPVSSISTAQLSPRLHKCTSTKGKKCRVVASLITVIAVYGLIGLGVVNLQVQCMCVGCGYIYSVYM